MTALRIGTVLALSVAVCLGLSGCGATKRALGLEKNTPDEFAVLNRGPLAMPPDFNLRPPAPGAERPLEGTAADQARSALVGRAKLESFRARGMSRGEVALLTHAGAGDAPADVRARLARETSSFAPEDKQMTDRLLKWQDETLGQGTALDPLAERRRLEQAKAEGRKPEGRVPTIGKAGGGGFLGIF